jgi:hypothetical protein
MRQKYPLKNRPNAGGLGPLHIEVISGRGKEWFTPVDIILATMAGRFDEMPPVAGLVSDISDAPAISYQTAQVQMNLTPTELRRLVMHNLTPKEFFALAERYGIFTEICFDFYDPDSGVAQQPKE